ncbi:hypothetical protein FRC02_004660 [Tulasnella sp. 418]|nr:hypothetical protein FRC02_004660 [Tulasnella sp. 418]
MRFLLNPSVDIQAITLRTLLTLIVGGLSKSIFTHLFSFQKRVPPFPYMTLATIYLFYLLVHIIVHAPIAWLHPSPTSNWLNSAIRSISITTPPPLGPSPKSSTLILLELLFPIDPTSASSFLCAPLPPSPPAPEELRFQNNRSKLPLTPAIAEVGAGALELPEKGSNGAFDNDPMLLLRTSPIGNFFPGMSPPIVVGSADVRSPEGEAVLLNGRT